MFLLHGVARVEQMICAIRCIHFKSKQLVDWQYISIVLVIFNHEKYITSELNEVSCCILLSFLGSPSHLYLCK